MTNEINPQIHPHYTLIKAIEAAEFYALIQHLNFTQYRLFYVRVKAREKGLHFESKITCERHHVQL